MSKINVHCMICLIICLIIFLIISITTASTRDVYDKPIPYNIPVLVISYFPVKGDKIDISITGDWGEKLSFTREKVKRQTAEVIAALEEGSRYHGYKYAGAPKSLKYHIINSMEFIQPLPTWNKPGYKVPFTDYNAIMKRINARYWVEERGVKEIWIWGYHGGKVGLWESNMAGPYGDISNSDRDPKDLPIFKSTYTVYHYNYQRGTSEATENHMHQIESLLGHIDGDFFWNYFVGKKGAWRCGNCHYPPNGEHDYDWANKKYVWTEIEDWRPEGGGKKIFINCEKWGCDSLKWFIYWMQNIPGRDNGLTNWWIFVGEFDYAMKNGIKLYRQ